MKVETAALFLFLAGCPARTATSTTPTGPTGPTEQGEPAVGSLEETYRVAIVAAGDEEAELREISRQSLEVLQSSEFRRSLLSLRTPESKVVSAVSELQPQFMTLTELADVVTLKSDALHKFRSHVVLHGTYFNTGRVYKGTCSLDGRTRDCNAFEFEDNRDNEFAATRVVTLGADSILETVIGRKIHERWRADSLGSKSCAINTFTHELLHAFSHAETTTVHTNSFVDTLELDKPEQYGDYPLATYAVGSVAQCTWLQKQGRVADDATSFEQCVWRFGLATFNSNECK